MILCGHSVSLDLYLVDSHKFDTLEKQCFTSICATRVSYVRLDPFHQNILQISFVNVLTTFFYPTVVGFLYEVNLKQIRTVQQVCYVALVVLSCGPVIICSLDLIKIIQDLDLSIIASSKSSSGVPDLKDVLQLQSFRENWHILCIMFNCRSRVTQMLRLLWQLERWAHTTFHIYFPTSNECLVSPVQFTISRSVFCCNLLKGIHSFELVQFCHQLHMISFVYARKNTKELKELRT